ncbi:MAG: (Fe-S)-binding protein, partial [Desulfovibrio sp.]|nr:(Fe-S)-binding protein [Desulfovibrio sp.]
RAGATTVTYHDSCHLKKGLGISKEPRALIQANPDYKLVEMKEADRCCGCGGSFTLYHYDLSRQIGQRKRNNIVASGAKVASAGCPACMMQMEDVLSHNGDSVLVKHPVEIYAESLK